MCDINRTGFFRPWSSEMVHRKVNDDNAAINEETKNIKVTKCEKPKGSDVEDTDSLDSAWSASSGIECYQRQRNVKREFRREHFFMRKRSIGSSSSTGSCDDPCATGGSCTFANYELGGRNKEQNDRVKTDTSLTIDSCQNVSSNNSTGAISSSTSLHSPGSAFTPTPWGIVYPNLGYSSPLLLEPIIPNWSPSNTEHTNLFYGLSPMPIGGYGNCMEEAVKFIHDQDVAAKHMKKLRPKKFRCHHCDVAFSNNGQLKGHIRIHTGERPFKCEVDGCNKAFTRNEELTRHRKIHTGLKPHTCEMCGKSFGRKDHLKKHQRTHQHRSLAAHFGPTMFGFMDHVGHYQSVPSGCAIPPCHFPISG